MFTLAHISDPHLAPLPTPRFSELASKRLFGFLNWQRKRRNIHQRDALDEVVADVAAQAPDHIAVTGDLVNISLPDEFKAARVWLAGLGGEHDVTVVPGNHDAYVRSMREGAVKSWSVYMSGDEGTKPELPFVRRRAGLAIVGLSTAVASMPMMATGRLGKEQTARLAEVLAQLGAERLFRVVLIHHPPESEPRRRRERLLDADGFREALANAGAELVLHGHDHVSSVTWLQGPKRRIPAVGVPSASAATGGHWEPAGYNLYRIDGAPNAWRCEMITRGFRGPDLTVGEIDRRILVRS
jgi:3',5'-cyclic AMP phosphodiesterase CpdA